VKPRKIEIGGGNVSQLKQRPGGKRAAETQSTWAATLFA
jgi:hypothetical protein